MIGDLEIGSYRCWFRLNYHALAKLIILFWFIPHAIDIIDPWWWNFIVSVRSVAAFPWNPFCIFAPFPAGLALVLMTGRNLHHIPASGKRDLKLVRISLFMYLNTFSRQLNEIFWKKYCLKLLSFRQHYLNLCRNSVDVCRSPLFRWNQSTIPMEVIAQTNLTIF